MLLPTTPHTILCKLIVLGGINSILSTKSVMAYASLFQMSWADQSIRPLKRLKQKLQKRRNPRKLRCSIPVVRLLMLLRLCWPRVSRWVLRSSTLIRKSATRSRLSLMVLSLWLALIIMLNARQVNADTFPTACLIFSQLQI